MGVTPLRGESKDSPLFLCINTTMSEIILISDLLDVRARKLKELEFYHNQMKELEEKMFFIQKEIQLTSKIIDMIQKETVIDISQYIKKQ